MKPTLLSRGIKSAVLAAFDLRGYRLENANHPSVDKCVILGAPHTSNWDFVFFLGVASRMGISPVFMGKHTLFKGAQARFMRDMGGIPVDQSKRGRYVEQVVAEFARRDELALVIAPEGSRGSEGEWRSGFYNIASAAGVPIVPAWVDQNRRLGGVGEALWPSGDYKADLGKLAAFYRSVRPDCKRFERLAAIAAKP